MKWGESAQLDCAKSLSAVGELLAQGPQKLRSLRKVVVYAGNEARTVNEIEFVPWKRAAIIQNGPQKR